ncbi:MAG: hypothetical protein N2Z22_00215 [Turneriella sp.]|nr:hypothetical protein [Turneriella sp.]
MQDKGEKRSYRQEFCELRNPHHKVVAAVGIFGPPVQLDFALFAIAATAARLEP